MKSLYHNGITMHMSTYSDDKAQVDINKLINNGEVQQYSGRIGCCIRNSLIFKDDNHKYYYNPNKLITDTLSKQLFNHLYNMYTKRLNKKQLYHLLLVMKQKIEINMLTVLLRIYAN